MSLVSWLLVSVLHACICEGRRANYAIIVSTSRLWSNYRDRVNIDLFHSTTKRMGIPDSRIFSMFGEEIPCNARNPFPARLYSAAPSRNPPIDTSGFRTDVKGNEVSRHNFLTFLEGRHKPFTPRHRRIDVSPDLPGNVLVYFTGHSAVGYTKFQDWEDVDANDIADALMGMRLMGYYDQMLWIGDTCRAASIHNTFYADKIAAIGSSNEEDKSYSVSRENEMGLSLMDRFTVASRSQLNSPAGLNGLSVEQYFSRIDSKWLESEATLRVTAGANTSATLIEYFGSAESVTRSGLDVGRWNVPPRDISYSPQLSVVDWLATPPVDTFKRINSLNDDRWRGASLHVIVLLCAIVVYLVFR